MGDYNYTNTDNSTSIERNGADGDKYDDCCSEFCHYYGVQLG